MSTPASMQMLHSGVRGGGLPAPSDAAVVAVGGGGVGCGCGGGDCGGGDGGDGGGRRALFFSLSFRLLTLFRSFLYTL